jgi:hypothetical protein
MKNKAVGTRQKERQTAGNLKTWQFENLPADRLV